MVGHRPTVPWVLFSELSTQNTSQLISRLSPVNNTVGALHQFCEIRYIVIKVSTITRMKTFNKNNWCEQMGNYNKSNKWILVWDILVVRLNLTRLYLCRNPTYNPTYHFINIICHYNPTFVHVRLQSIFIQRLFSHYKWRKQCVHTCGYIPSHLFAT